MSTTSRPILLVEAALVQQAVGGLTDAHPLVVFSDPDEVRRYLLDAKRRADSDPAERSAPGALSLMSRINSATDTPVIYFGPDLGLPHLYRMHFQPSMA